MADFAPPEAKADFDAVWKVFLRDGKQRGEDQLQMSDGRLCDIEFSATADVLPGRHLSILRDSLTGLPNGGRAHSPAPAALADHPVSAPT